MILGPRDPKIDQNGAQERSKNELGGKSFSKTTKGERPGHSFWAFWRQLRDFGGHFGVQLGAKVLPKSTFLAPGRAKMTKNAIQNEASKKYEFFDWIFVRKY